MKITAKTVGALKLPHGKHDAIYFCDDLPGFGCRLRASGDRVRRSWVAQYRNFGRTRRVLLGPAELLTVEQARAAAKKVLARATLGHDPQAEKVARRQKATHSLRGVVGDYLAFKQRQCEPAPMARSCATSRGIFSSLCTTPQSTKSPGRMSPLGSQRSRWRTAASPPAGRGLR